MRPAPHVPPTAPAAARRRKSAAAAQCRPAVALLVLASVPFTAIAQSSTAGDAVPSADARKHLAQIAGVAPPASQPAIRISDAPAGVRELYDSALDFIDDGNLVLAEVRLDAAIAAAGVPVYDIFYEAGRVKLALRGPTAARDAAEKAATLRPAAADPRFLLGDIYERLGDLPAAVANFRTATLAAERELNNPQVTAAWFRLGALLERQGLLTAADEAYARFDDAIWESHVEHRGAAAVAPILARHPTGAVEQRLALLQRLGRANEAVDVAAAAAARAPDSPELARRHVLVLLAAGKAEAALAMCRKHLTATQPGSSGPAGGFLSLAVQAATAAGSLNAWLADVIAGVDRGEQLDLARNLARVLSQSEAVGTSAPLWAALQKRDPQDAVIAWGLAQALRDAGEYDRAFETLAEFLRTAKRDSAVPAAALLAWMRPAPAARKFTDALTKASTRPERDPTFDFVVGAAAVAAQQTGLAEQLLRLSIAASPDHAPAEAAWGQMCLNAWQWEEARKHADAALRASPQFALAHLIRAEACAGLDENDAATQAFKEAIRAAPQDATCRLALAAHSRRLGELTAGQRYCQEALSLDLTSGPAAEGLIECYLEEEKYELARQILARAERLDIPDAALRRARTAVRYADARFQNEHLAELRRQFDENPQDGQTALALALGSLLRTRIDDAALAVDRAQQLLPDDLRVLVLAARVRAAQLRLDQSITILESVQRRFPNRESTLRLLVEAYFDDFRPAEARAILQRLIERATTEDDRTSLQLTLVQSHLDFREFDAALGIIDAALLARPDAEVLTAARIAVLRQATRYREALEAATAWLDAGPDHTDRRLEFLRSALAARDFEAATRRVGEWRTATPEDPITLHWHVKVLLAAGRAETALEMLGDLRPHDLDMDFHRRMLLARSKAAAGKFDSALAELDALLGERALERGGYIDVCRTAVVEICMKYNAADAALERMERWRAAEPAAGAYEELRNLLRKRSLLSAANRLDDCIAVLEDLLERVTAQNETADELFFGLNNDLGYMLVDQGKQLERATGMLRRAVAAQPRNAAFLDSYGWALYKSGDFAGAERYISRAVMLERGQDAVLFDHLGDAQHRLGDTAAAEKSWRKSVDLLADDAERIYQQENETDDVVLPSPPELLAQVRAKLAALERKAAPPVAPLAPGH